MLGTSDLRSDGSVPFIFNYHRTFSYISDDDVLITHFKVIVDNKKEDQRSISVSDNV